MINHAIEKTEPKTAGPTNAASAACVSIRVSPHGYFAALFLLTFLSAFFVYLDAMAIGVGLMIAAWTVLPVLAFSDHIAFDGRRISRTGILPNAWAKLNSVRRRLKISDVEQVETQAMRALKRGRNVSYRYRTLIRGKGVTFAFASGGDDYRRMAEAIFPRVSENALDNRSIEIRDYLADPKTVLDDARSAHIPSSEVLENSLRELSSGRSTRSRNPVIDENSTEEAVRLRHLANQLRLSGFLLQAMEGFRRAILLRPADGWLWLEFGRCLHSLAGSEKDPRLNRRSIAMMRLAERHAGSDGALLTRLGESYYQAGEWDRSASVFRKAIAAAGENFRSARGLAEVALREGKIAHVIHNFWTANRSVDTPSLRRWSRGEADYFARLNGDDEYMEMELSRVTLHDRLERFQKSALRLALFGFPCILLGIATEEYPVANTGWTISLIAISVWVALSAGRHLLASRIPYHLLETEDDD